MNAGLLHRWHLSVCKRPPIKRSASVPTRSLKSWSPSTTRGARVLPASHARFQESKAAVIRATKKALAKRMRRANPFNKTDAGNSSYGIYVFDGLAWGNELISNG